jgi:transposase-like protein
LHETLAYCGFPEEHWRLIRTNNPLERTLREIKRRTKVVGASPTETRFSTSPLPASGTQWSAQRYLNIQLLKVS